jgi:hypothetical protein
MAGNEKDGKSVPTEHTAFGVQRPDPNMALNSQRPISKAVQAPRPPKPKD